jgi:hypothetical protein
MADTSWGFSTWGNFTYGGQAINVNVGIGNDAGWGAASWGQREWDQNGLAFPDQLTIQSPNDAWGLDIWGADSWGGILALQVNVFGTANIVPNSTELSFELGNLTFAGIGNITVTGNQLSLTLDDATVVADNNIELTTNLLQALVQSPSISADSFTEAVTGIQLNSTTGSVNFKLDAQFTPTGSESYCWNYTTNCSFTNYCKIRSRPISYC